MGCASLNQHPINKRFDNTMIIGNNILSETSTKVDDEEEIKKRGQFIKISAIRASHSKGNVQSFQIAYELDCGSIISGLNHHKTEIEKEKEKESCGVQKNSKKSENLKNVNRKTKSLSNLAQQSSINSQNSLKNEVFEILEDDYLQEISGRIGQQVEQLTFKTYKGRQITFGSARKGKQFSIKLSNETFGPFTTNKEMNSIKIPIIPIPEQFQQEQNNQNIMHSYKRNRTH